MFSVTGLKAFGGPGMGKRNILSSSASSAVLVYTQHEEAQDQQQQSHQKSKKPFKKYHLNQVFIFLDCERFALIDF